MYANKTNEVKLISALAVLAMVVCALCVLAPTSEAAPVAPEGDPFDGMYTGTTASYDDDTGVFSVTGDTVVTLTGNVGSSAAPLDFKIEIAAGATLTIQNNEGNSYGINIHYTSAGGNGVQKSVVYGGANDSDYGVLALDGVDMSITLDRDTGVAELGDCHAIYNADVTLSGAASLSITQMAGMAGVSWWCGSTANLNTLTMTEGSELILNNANGIAGIVADVTDSAITITNPKAGKAFINLGADSEIDNSTIISASTATNGMELYLGADVSITNSTVDMGASSVVVLGGATVNASGSTIDATEIKYRGTGVATITGATVTGDFVNDTSVETPATNPAVILNDVTLQGTNTSTGVLIGTQAGSTLTVPAGSSFTSTREITMNGTLVNGGTVQVTNVGGTPTKVIAGPNSTTTGIEYDAETFTVFRGATVTVPTGTTVSYAEDIEAGSFSELASYVAANIEKIDVIASTIDVTDNLTIPYGMTVRIAVDQSGLDNLTIGNADVTEQLTVEAGKTLTIEGTLLVQNAVVIEAGATLIVEGTLTANEILVGTAADDSMTGTPADVGVLENSGIINVQNEIYVSKDGSVENSGDMYIGAASIVNGTFENSGAVGVYDDATGVVEITGIGTFNNLAGGVVGFPVNTTTVIGVTYDVTMTQDITQSTTFGSLQNVIIPEGAVLTIQRTATLTINGTLTVLGTLNVEGQLVIASAAGAQLVIDGTVNVNTTGNNQGRVVIGQAGEPGYATVNNTLSVGDGSLVDIVNGALTVNGTMSMLAGSELRSSVTVPNAEQEELGVNPYIAASGLVVAANGTLQLAGDLVSDVAISNYGNIEINNGSSTATGDLKIFISGRDATTTLATFGMKGSLTITDESLLLREGNRTTSHVRVLNADANSFTFNAGALPAVLNGTLSFSETVTTRTTSSGATEYLNNLAISGSISASLDTSDQASDYRIDGSKDSVTMQVNGPRVQVTDELNLGAYVIMDNNSTMSVSGTITNTASGAQPINNNDGHITVSGLITASAAISPLGDITAAYYIITSGSPAVTTHNYSTLETAVPAVAAETNTATKNITVYGNLVVSESIDVPAGITITVFRGATLTIGPETDGQDVTVTMADGAKMTSNSQGVIVNGTLYFTDKTDDSTVKTVSDVTVESEDRNGYRIYRNIYTALAEAEAGQTVTVTKETGYVNLNQNLTIPEGVTLVVPNRAVPLVLSDGVTLTVDGTLQTELDVYAKTQFATKAMNVTNGVKSSAVIVNGTMMTSVQSVYSDDRVLGTEAGFTTYASMTKGAPIYGAYYMMGNWYVVSNMAIAQQNYADIESQSIVVNGPVTAGDLSFTAGANDVCNTIVISDDYVYAPDNNTNSITSSLTVSSLSISGFGVEVQSGAVINGTVSTASSSVDFDGIAGSGTGMVLSDNQGTLVLTGVAYQDEDASLVIASGAVNAGVSGSTPATFTYNVDSDAETGMVVAAEATLNAINVSDIDNLTVNGTMNMASNNTATFGVLTVNGTATIAASTDTASAATANVTDKLVIGASANFSGPLASVQKYVQVYNGATVDATALATFGDYSTEFYVEDALWITVYEKEVSGTNATPISGTTFKPTVENAWFNGWYNADNESADNENVGSADFTRVYASIDYDVYYIVVLANQAVDDVYIDNNLMEYGMILTGDSGNFYYGYTAFVSAGNHSVSYTLANGYSGEGVLSVNGQEMSDLAFTTSGTPTTDDIQLGSDGVHYIQYNLQLTGFEKSGYVPDSPDTPSDSGDDGGMTITDYLLIVLVVLIIVMAIIVAMRLMRS